MTSGRLFTRKSVQKLLKTRPRTLCVSISTGRNGPMKSRCAPGPRIRWKRPARVTTTRCQSETIIAFHNIVLSCYRYLVSELLRSRFSVSHWKQRELNQARRNFTIYRGLSWLSALRALRLHLPAPSFELYPKRIDRYAPSCGVTAKRMIVNMACYLFLSIMICRPQKVKYFLMKNSQLLTHWPNQRSGAVVIHGT